MCLIDIILWIVSLIMISLIVPSVILGVVIFFEIKRGLIAEVFPDADLREVTLASFIGEVSNNQHRIKSNRDIFFWTMARWGLFFYGYLKSQKIIYGMLVITTSLLILLFFISPIVMVSKFNDYHFGAVFNVLGLMFYFYILVVSLILFDARHYLLPDPLNYLLLWGGIIGALLGISVISLEESVIAVIVVYLLLFGIRLSYQWAGKKDALGLGDLKLSAALAAWCGVEIIFSVLLFSVLLALSYIALKWIKQRVEIQIIPFGPFLGISGIIHYLILFLFR